VIGARALAEPPAVAEVARLCGRLPLALRIAGQILATHSSWSVARLEQMLAGEQGRLARLGVGDRQVRAAFEVTASRPNVWNSSRRTPGLAAVGQSCVAGGLPDRPPFFIASRSSPR